MKKLTAVLLAFAPIFSLHAKLVTKTVAYEDGAVKCAGYLAYDDAKTGAGKIPGVIVVPEWWGVTDYVKGRAEQLANLGYVAFVADMYGAGTSTTDAKKATELSAPFYAPTSTLMVSRSQAALKALLATKLVATKEVAAIGYCFGGSTVQALAYSGAPLAGIVSFHGVLIPVPSDAAAKNHAKILMCNGAIDPMVPAKEIETFMHAMNDGKFDYQFIDYAGALHAFTNPGADQAAVANGMVGKIGYNAAADKRSWRLMQDFFGEVFAGKK